LDGHPGFEVESEPKPGIKMYSRVYYVSGLIFMTVAGGGDKPDTAEGAKVFLDSFRLIKPVAVQAPPSKEWKEVVSKEGRFSVSMPGNVTKPETIKEKEPFGPVEMIGQGAFLYEAKQSYSIMYVDLPPAETAPGAEAVFTKAFSMLAQG